MNFKELSFPNKFIVVINGLLSLFFIFRSGDFLLSHFISSMRDGQFFFDFISAVFALVGALAIAFHTGVIFFNPTVLWQNDSFLAKIRQFSRGISVVFALYLLGATTVGIIFSFGLPSGEGPGFLTGAGIWLAMFFVSGCLILGALIK